MRGSREVSPSADITVSCYNVCVTMYVTRHAIIIHCAYIAFWDCSFGNGIGCLSVGLCA